MSIRQFQIYFDNPSVAFYGGQVVTGKLVVHIISPLQVRGIELQFRGEANVQWSENRMEADENNRQQKVSDVYSASELYFDNRYYILGGPTCSMMLQPGDHMYGFSMQLPAVLPCSFEGKYGHIRYTLKATMECIGHTNHTARVAFSVLLPLDLNHEPNVKNQVQVVEDKYLCCCCCKSGPITAVVSLPSSGYVPGQEIPMAVEVDNNSNKAVSSVICTLQKFVTFQVVRPERKSRSDTIKVAQMVLGGVEPNGSFTWNERLTVPSLPPSYLRNCNIIDVAYSLLIEVRIPGLHKNMNVTIPVVLGTIPIYSFQPGAVSPSAPAAIQEFDPPSYEECAFRSSDFRETDDNPYAQGFAPRYPTYHFPQ